MHMTVKSHPKVSVLVPAYNEQKYIANALACLLEQDYPHFEIVVVNNASTDQTEQVIRYFIQNHPGAEFKIRYAYEPLRGTQHARECGRKLATGEVIAQLDADCLPPKDWITKGVRYLCRPHVVAVTGPYDYYDSRIVVRLITGASQRIFLRILTNIVQWMRRGAVLIGGNAFIWSHVLQLAGGYNTLLTFYGDDVDIALRISAYGYIRFDRRLVVRSSSRRYDAMGFFNVQKKYTRFFFRSVFSQPVTPVESAELLHPR